MTDPVQMLRDAGVRVTGQRTTVLTILCHAPGHPMAEEVHEQARRRDDTLSLATVYRTMAVLEAAGLIRKLIFDDAPARYEMMPHSEHDHLIDIDTGELIEIPGDEMTRLRDAIAARMGYEIVSQHVILRGRRKR